MTEAEVEQLKKDFIECVNVINSEFGPFDWYDKFDPIEEYELAKFWFDNWKGKYKNFEDED